MSRGNLVVTMCAHNQKRSHHPGRQCDTHDSVEEHRPTFHGGDSDAKTIYVLLLSAFIGVMAGLLLNGSAVTADTCTNVYCGPGDTGCSFQDNWDCYMYNGNCVGSGVCW